MESKHFHYLMKISQFNLSIFNLNLPFLVQFSVQQIMYKTYISILIPKTYSSLGKNNWNFQINSTDTMLFFHHSLFFSKQHSKTDPPSPITSILHFQLGYSFNTAWCSRNASCTLIGNGGMSRDLTPFPPFRWMKYGNESDS